MIKRIHSGPLLNLLYVKKHKKMVALYESGCLGVFSVKDSNFTLKYKYVDNANRFRRVHLYKDNFLLL